MRLFLPAVLLFLLPIGVAGAGAPRPLVRAHAHNDYEHKRPLQDALDQGFCSVEADIYLIEGRLLVGHQAWELKPDRTLQSLYLEPLKQRIAMNGGRVYRGGPTVTLMIDVKSDAASSYAALRDVLKAYEPLLTVFHKDGSVEERAIRVVISGNRDRRTMAAEDVRCAALDGRLDDLDADPSPAPSLVPWVSADWAKVFKWKGDGPIDPDDLAKLKQLVDKAHAQKRLIRFWDAPDNATAWKILYEAGVDLINTDDLAGLAKFLQ
ncbi:MAG TPA: phosphatidylinositol-specific phospholipase C/glycerophosphodiester phosphodiesterase family protein [Tepidisphaeraceae bacterium]|jgi:hypothetical protein